MPHPDKMDIMPHLPQDWVDRLDDLSSQIPDYPDAEITDKWVKEFIKVGFFPPLAYVGQATLGALPGVSSAPTPTAVLAAPAAAVSASPVAPAPAVAAALPTTTVAGPPAPAATPYTPVPSAPSGNSAGDPDVIAFCAKENLAPAVKFNKHVPMCYTEGPPSAEHPERAEIGFNPAKWPCEKGCPRRSPCQLGKLGLAAP